ncbi:hypothetical protein [Ectobacillus sp. sgz5001026]|uniref:hypothetical protein n=1 Tax=Ectobacillus sp. sgz5001026 TaxID=3242473 RepID=UPI0036D21DCD
MGEVEMSNGKRLVFIWLILSEVLLACTLVIWVMGFIFAIAELVMPLWLVIGSYPIFIIVSAFMAWREYMKGNYRNTVLWSLFPIIWYGLVYGLTFIS